MDMTGKQLHHILRLYDFIQNYDAGKPFAECLTSYTDYNLLIDAKLNKIPLNKAEQLASEHTEKIKAIMNSGLRKFRPGYENEVIDIMNSTLMEIFSLQLKKDISGEKQKVVTPNEYKNTFVTSDLHFGHKNILKFEDDRWEILLGTIRQRALVNYVLHDLKIPNSQHISKEEWNKYEDEICRRYIDAHDEALINRWNSVVGKRDLVYILGDLSFRNGRETNEILKRLNGDKVLVSGNHDNIWMDKYCDLSLFKEVVDYKEFDYMKHHFVLSHYPIQSYNKANKGGIHLFGHIHSNELQYPIHNAWNVGVDVNNYRPVPIEQYIGYYSDF